MSGKILIVGSDPNEIGAVSGPSCEAGCETVVVRQGSAAVGKVAEVQPDVVVMSAALDV